MAVIELDDKKLQELIEEKKNVLIDFWAPWCGPCKLLAPIIEELSNEIEGIVFAKLNVEEQPETALKYKIFAVPTILFIKSGNVVERIVGAQNKNTLLEKIKEILS